jgi:hypothetical protein
VFLAHLRHHGTGRAGHTRAGFEGVLRDQPVEQPEQFANILDVVTRQFLERIVTERERARRAPELQDAEARLELGRGDVGDQPTRHPRQQALVEGIELGGRAIAREHDLESPAMGLVDQPQQLGLRLGLSFEELDVVEQENTDRFPLATPHIQVSTSHRGTQLLGVILRGAILHAQAGINLPCVVPDRGKQVRLAEP